MATDDEWTIVKPGEEPPPAIASGPSASEWTIVSPGASREARSPPLTASDAANLAYMGANSFTFGLGNRASAVGAALGKGTSYGEELARINAIDEEMRRKHPYWSMGAELGGGIGNAAALVRTGVLRGAPAGASWLAQGVRGAGEGGALGALQGAGTTYSGIPSDYVHNAGMGGVLGAGVGAAAGPIGSLVGGAYRAIADRGWGKQGIPGQLARNAQADEAGLRNLPPGGMVPDAGPSLLGSAQGNVTQGPGSSLLIGNLKARNEASPTRITTHINQDFGEAPVPSFVERDIKTRMSEMGNAYDQAFANARAVDPNPIALYVEGQIGRTAGAAQDALRRVRTDLDIPTNPGVLDPHPERLHAVRSGIKAQLNDPNVDGNTKRVLAQVEQRLSQELWNKVPGIRQIDDAYAELGSQARAIGGDPQSAGRKMFQTGQDVVYRPQELAETMTEAVQPKGTNIGPSAEGLRLQQAARGELERIVGTNKNDLNALDNVLAQPQDWNSQKLAIVFGQERADRLAEVLRNEKTFRDTYQKIYEGTQTHRRGEAAKLAEGEEGKIPTDLSVLGMVGRGGQELWRTARRSAINANRDRIAGMLATQDPIELQTLVDRLLAAQPTRDVRQEIAKRLAERGLIGGASALPPSTTNR